MRECDKILKYCKFKTGSSEETNKLFESLFKAGIGLRYTIMYVENEYHKKRFFRNDKYGFSTVYEHEYHKCEEVEVELSDIFKILEEQTSVKTTGEK